MRKIQPCINKFKFIGVHPWEDFSSYGKSLDEMIEKFYDINPYSDIKENWDTERVKEGIIFSHKENYLITYKIEYEKNKF